MIYNYIGFTHCIDDYWHLQHNIGQNLFFDFYFLRIINQGSI
jgi:hypothetical protein